MNFTKLLKYSPIILITLLGAALRLFQLNQSPSGMLVDEPSFGYNAYSILKTAKDEHGKFLPLVFETYGDEKMPLQFYLIVPFIWLFGLTTYAVRLPAALAGVAFIPLIYLVIRELHMSKKAALFTAFIASISPWVFYISRFTRETTIGLLVLTVAILFLLKHLNQNRNYFLYLCSFFLALSWYSYVPYRLVTIILVLAILVWFIFKRSMSKKTLVFFISIFLLAIAPLVLFTSVGTARLSQIGIQSDQGFVLEINEKRTYCATSAPDILCYAAFNKPTVWGRVLLNRYIQVFSPEFLFTEGIKDLPIFSVKSFGMLPFFALPFYILSIFYLLKKSDTLSSISRYFIIIGLIAAPLPSIIVGDAQNMRLAPVLPFIFILMALGFTYLNQNFKFFKLTFTFLTIGIVIQSLIFYNTFFTVHTVMHDLQYNSHLYGLFQFVKQHDNDSKFYVNSFFAEPITYYAFYTAADPALYQSTVEWFDREDQGFKHAKKFKNMQVTDQAIDELICKTNIEKAFFITDKNYTNLNRARVYTAISLNNVYDYAYIYDLASVKQSAVYKCSSLSI